jgi:putative glutamine amidotransferase
VTFPPGTHAPPSQSLPPQPLIGITTSLAPGGSHALPHVMLGAQYVEAVERVGGVAVLLSPAHAPAALRRLLDLLDGLVLSGGEDVDPARYGQAPHPALGDTNPARDAMEFAVLEGALTRECPVLAICRGMQLLNVAWGGTLLQDLPSQREGPIAHRQRAPVDQAWHEVVVEAGSGLHAALGVDSLRVNSFHHQGIDRLAAGLRCSARAPDGLVEGVESVDGRWIRGVQWHPERGRSETPDGADANEALFRALVEASAGARR